MRIAFISDTNLSLGLATRVEIEGHDVRFSNSHPESAFGLVKPISSKEVWSPDILVYDSNEFVSHADSARNEGFKTIGPSRWSATIESDETYLNQIKASVGWPVENLQQGAHMYASGLFNGVSFISIYTSIVYRRYMAGGAGPDLACTGMVSNFQPMTEKTYNTFLAPIEKMLRRVNYRGFLHIHTVVDGDKFSIKEICTALTHPLSLVVFENCNVSATNILLRILDEGSKPLRTIAPWACGVQLSSPPFPYADLTERREIRGIVPQNLKHIYPADIIQDGGKYYVVNKGLVGYVTSRGQCENECVRRLYRTVGNIQYPDLQFRVDIGKNIQSLLTSLRTPGWLI